MLAIAVASFAVGTVVRVYGALLGKMAQTLNGQV